MQIYLVPGEGYFAEIIRTFKRQTLTRHGHSLPVPPELYEPLPIAQYLIARTEDGTRAFGLAEGYFLDQAHDGYEAIAPELAAAVAPLCPFDKLAFFQTVYVEPELRTTTAYLYLCLAMMRLGVELGAQGGVCFTSVGSEFHRRLYEKTGGQIVAHVDVTYANGTCLRDAAYYFDLPVVCAHPRMERVKALSQIDMGLARATYNWRYDHSTETEAPPELR